MDEHETVHNTKRQAGIAAMLSLIFPGLGQIYCGRLITGMFFIFLSLLPLQMMLILPMFRAQPPEPVFYAALLGISAAFGICTAVDAWLLARRTRSDYILKEYNCQPFYVLLCLSACGWSIGLVTTIRQNVVEAMCIGSTSMEPGLVIGNRILISKCIYQSRKPVAGEVVIFPNPDEPRRTWIKRVIAVAGDTVAVKGELAYVNGKPLAIGSVTITDANAEHHPRLIQLAEKAAGTTYTISMSRGRGSVPSDFPETVVPKNHVFVLSDNRDQNTDSRRFGPIPIALIKGRADCVYWPLEDWSRIGTAQ